MAVDRPQSPAAVDVPATSKLTEGASDVAPFSDGVPEVPAEKVNVATVNSAEPTRLTEKALTTSVSDEVVSTAMAQPVTSN
jgi:hypothetical protein